MAGEDTGQLGTGTPTLTPAELALREPMPISLNEQQWNAAKQWAADDRLWTTQETVEFHLRTFARVILKFADKFDTRSAMLRAALVGLVGVDGREELEQMEAVMRLMPAPAADKAATIDAIHALIATTPTSDAVDPVVAAKG